MNILSVFDGMSCGQIALNRAGISYAAYFASEVDKYAIRITQKNYPQTLQLGDVQLISAKNLPKIDLLIGGSPCQGFSVAGYRQGFDDPRSRLFWHYVRLLKETQPRWFLLENVRMTKQNLDIISAALHCEPVEIDSALVSAQMRKRLYWTNIPLTPIEDRGIMLQDILESGYTDRQKSYAIDANYYRGGSLKNYLEKKRRQIVFTQSERRLYDLYDTIRKLTPTECEKLQTVPVGYTEGVSNTQRYKMLGNGWTVDVIVHIFKGLL